MLVGLYGYRFLKDTISQETPCYSGPYNIYPFSFFSCIQVHGIKSIVKSFFFTLCRCACASVVNIRCLFLGIRSLTGHGVHQVSYGGKVPCFTTWVGDVN